MRARLLAALLLAFGPLLIATPAYGADWITQNGHVVDGTVQFDYRGGTATQNLTAPEGSTLTISVNNTTANCIGNCQPRPDVWTLSVAGQQFSGETIEQREITVQVSGDFTLTVTGRDMGFWAGWYGPIFSAPMITAPVEPEPVETGTWEGQLFTAIAPAGEIFTAVTGWYGAPTDPNCGADVSATLAQFLGNPTFSVSADNGVFGDPCGGVVKVLRVQLSSTATPTPTETPRTPEPSASPSATPTLEPTPEPVAPEPQPTSQPEPPATPSVDAVDVPVVPPVVLPPVVEPVPQPQPIPFPVTPAPEPAPEPAPTPAPAPEPAPEPEATPPPAPEPKPTVEPAPEPPAEAPEPPVEAPPAPPEVIAPKPAPAPPTPLADVDPKTLDPDALTPAEVTQLTAAAIETLATEPQGSPAYERALEQLMVVAQADDEELPAELAAIPLLGDAAGAVLEAFNAIGNIGSDISPKVREQAKKTAIATIAVGTATTASAVAAAGSVGYRRER